MSTSIETALLELSERVAEFTLDAHLRGDQAGRLRDAVGAAAAAVRRRVERIAMAQAQAGIPSSTRNALELLSVRLHGTGAAVTTLSGSFGELEGVLSDFATEAVVGADALSETCADCLDRAEDQFSGLSDIFDEQILQKVGDLEQRFLALSDGIAVAVEERLSDVPTAFVDQLRVEYISRVEINEEVVSDAAEQLAGRISAAFEGLDGYMRDVFLSKFEHKVEDISTRVLNGLAEDAIENVTLTQLSTTVTAAIGPYLPALMAARALLGAIQSTLHAVRMGF